MSDKKCGKCQITLISGENWSLSSQKRKKTICSQCLRDYANNKYEENKLKISDNNAIKRSKIRLSVIEYYGGKCELCNETNPNVLSLDHIDGHGRKHRKEVLGGNDSGTAFFKWVLKHKPTNIRLLCYNCNCQHSMTKTEITEQYDEGCKYCGGERIRHRHICSLCKTSIKRNRYIDLKLLVFKHYGCKCKDCGVEALEFLTIDHINDDGAEHRVEIGPHIFPWLKKNDYPEGFQILCYNCNYLKRNRKLALKRLNRF